MNKLRPNRAISNFELVQYDESVVKLHEFIRVSNINKGNKMKLLKYLFASIALIAGTAHANTISTTIRIDDAPINQTVGYVNFDVTDSGFFKLQLTQVFLMA